MDQPPNSLIVLDKFRALLAKAETLEEVTDLRSKAEAVRVWARSAAAGLEAQNKAAALKLRAERKAGELLSTLKLRGGDRKSNGHDDRLNLADLGINQAQSKRWQKEAKVPEAEFEHYVRQADDMGEELTAAGLLRLARKIGTPSPINSDIEPPTPLGLPGSDNLLRVHHQDGGQATLSASDATDLLELIEEINNHHGLLCNLLSPICTGKGETLLPAQRQALRHYLSETGRLLAHALAVQRSDGDAVFQEPTSKSHRA